jgi:hypothetical protein
VLQKSRHGGSIWRLVGSSWSDFKQIIRLVGRLFPGCFESPSYPLYPYPLEYPLPFALYPYTLKLVLFESTLYPLYPYTIPLWSALSLRSPLATLYHCPIGVSSPFDHSTIVPFGVPPPLPVTLEPLRPYPVPVYTHTLTFGGTLLLWVTLTHLECPYTLYARTLWSTPALTRYPYTLMLALFESTPYPLYPYTLPLWSTLSPPAPLYPHPLEYPYPFPIIP